MIDLRQKAFNSISRVLAITRYDIEQRQKINDLGLNIQEKITLEMCSILCTNTPLKMTTLKVKIVLALI